MLVGYARISPMDQTPQTQIVALTEAGCDRIFKETSLEAWPDRAQLVAAIDYMCEGDTLVVCRLNRLAWSRWQLFKTIEDLETRKIQLRSLTEAIDTTTASGKMVFHAFAVLAEFQRSLFRERVIEGLEAARAQGRVGGRPRALSDEDLAVAEAMLKGKEFTATAVAKRLGVSRTTLWRRLGEARREAGCDAGA